MSNPQETVLELEPCPWCGSVLPADTEPRFGYAVWKKSDMEEARYAIVCKCGVRGPFSITEKGAKLLWNGFVKRVG